MDDHTHRSSHSTRTPNSREPGLPSGLAPFYHPPPPRIGPPAHPLLSAQTGKTNAETGYSGTRPQKRMQTNKRTAVKIVQKNSGVQAKKEQVVETPCESHEKTSKDNFFQDPGEVAR